MRTQSFARVIVSITAFGLVINSACAPDTKQRKINVGKHGGNGFGSSLLTGVKNNPGQCGNSTTPSKEDAKTLQAAIANLVGQGEAITADQLPVGQYKLVKTIGNVQAHNIQTAAAAGSLAPPTAATDGEFDRYSESDINPGSTLENTCVKNAVGGSTPNQDKDQGRDFSIDTAFAVDAKRGIVGVTQATYRINSTSTVGVMMPQPTPPGQSGVSNAEIQAAQQAQLADMQAHGATAKQIQERQKRMIPASNAYSLIRVMLMNKNADGTPNVNGDKQYANVIDATNTNPQTHMAQYPGASATVALRKISDTQYELVINVLEANPAGNDAMNPSRQIVLIYGYMSPAPTTAAGNQKSAADTATPAKAPDAALPPAGAAPGTEVNGGMKTPATATPSTSDSAAQPAAPATAAPSTTDSAAPPPAAPINIDPQADGAPAVPGNN